MFLYLHAHAHMCMHMNVQKYTSSCDQSTTTHDQFYLLKERLMIATSLEFYDSFLKENLIFMISLCLLMFGNYIFYTYNDLYIYVSIYPLMRNHYYF